MSTYKPQAEIAFFGTPKFATAFLDTLEANQYRPSCIVTTPDRPQGRGLRVIPPATKTWAESNGVPVFQPETLKGGEVTFFSNQPWDLFIVIAYGKLLPEYIINLPRHGTINIHYSLLPKYRGATPVESAIVNGDQKTGVSIQNMRLQLDTGPVYAKREIPILPSDTSITLRQKLTEEAREILVPTIEKILTKTISPIEQDDHLATYCTKIIKEDGAISLQDDPLTLDRKFRAYQPWPGIYFFAQRNGLPIRVKITEAHFDGSRFTPLMVVPENEKPISFESFLRLPGLDTTLFS